MGHTAFMGSTPNREPRRSANRGVCADRRARQLLDRDDELSSVVGEALARMCDAFPEAHIAIEHFVDPDDGDRTERVYVVAYPSLSLEEAEAIFERDIDPWWDENITRAGGRFSLSVYPAA